MHKDPNQRGGAGSSVQTNLANMRGLSGALGILICVLGGCKTALEPDYGRALHPGASALRKLPHDQWPSFGAAWQAVDSGLTEALDRSVDWFSKPSTTEFFPIDDITHERARLSVLAMRYVLEESDSPGHFELILRREFDVYGSVGWDDRGTVLFTGYYAPIFNASKTRSHAYAQPLYGRPDDLVSDASTGQILGRRVGSTLLRYPTRAQIEAAPEMVGLAGRELVYLRDKLEAYLVQVNGSARLKMTDGTTMHVGYAGSNGRSYTSIGQLLVRDGAIRKGQLSLSNLRAFFQSHPEQIDRYINQNERFIFFQTYEHHRWPAGSLGFKVTPWRSLATDKRIFPRGGVVLVVTQLSKPESGGNGAAGVQPFAQLMVDQDTGGAIRAAGRADIYMGIGPDAESSAGRQAAEGRSYYLFLKPKRLVHWRQRAEAMPIARLHAQP